MIPIKQITGLVAALDGKQDDSQLLSDIVANFAAAADGKALVKTGTTLDFATPTVTFPNQNANVIFAGPATGGAAGPAFRALVYADISTLIGTSSTSIAAGNDSRFHTQGTDAGTTQASFQIASGATGPRIKNSSGVLQVRNAADDADASLTCADLTVAGTAIMARPVIEVTNNRTLGLIDIGAYLNCTNTASITLTLPSATFSGVAEILIARNGSGAVNIAPSGTTINGASSTLAIAGVGQHILLKRTGSSAWVAHFVAITVSTGTAQAGQIPAANPSGRLDSSWTHRDVAAETGTTYSVTSADNGRTIVFNNAANITLTFPTGLPTNFAMMAIQRGAGRILWAGAGVTFFLGPSQSGHTRSAGANARLSFVYGGAANTIDVMGDTAT